MSKMIRGYKKEDFSSPSIIFKLDISIYAKMTYLYLQMLLDVEGSAMPSHAEIGHYISASRTSAKRAIYELEEIGLIQAIRRKKNGKENDSNLYIVYHPKQIEGLKMLPDYEEIKYQKKKKKPVVSQTTPSETCGLTDHTQKPVVSQTTPSETYGQTDHTPSEKPSNIKGFEETYGLTEPDTTNSSSNIEEVEEEEEDIVTTAIEEIKLAYKKYLKGEISTQQAESFLEVALDNNMTLDDIITEIKYIAENVTIKWNAPGTVYTCLSDGGWSKQPNQFEQQNKTKKQKRRVNRFSKAVEEQLKQERNGSQNQQNMSEEELAERRARLYAKMKYMDETLAASQQQREQEQAI